MAKTKQTEVPASTQNNEVPAEPEPVVRYTTQVQNKGWLPTVVDGAMSGTTGQNLRMEAIRLSVGQLPEGMTGGIAYSAHVHNVGWQSEVGNAATAGTVGKSLQMEAIRIHLTGQLADDYSIYYRVHTQNIGWTAYAKDNEIAGSIGMNWRMEAIEVVLVKHGQLAPTAADSVAFKVLNMPTLSYQAHTKNIGWGAAQAAGQVAGTMGRSLQMEAMKISASELGEGLTGGLSYQAHVQFKGWMPSVSEGEQAGTTGLGLRQEAFAVSGTGAISKYFNVWYQAFVQNKGWMGWTKNGQYAGTTGLELRLEAIRVKLVPKGAAAPGSTANSFIKKTSGWRSVNGQLKYYDIESKKYTKTFSLKYYSQLDKQWSSKSYGGYKFGPTGCGQASIAMIISGFGTAVTPTMAADYSYAHGTFDKGGPGSLESDMTMVAEHFGINWHVMGSAGELSKCLAMGYPATVCLNVGSSVRHIVVLSGYSAGGYTNVSDPWNGLIFSGRHKVSEIWGKLSWLAGNRNKGASAAVVYYGDMYIGS
ncbi:C39 family peptidase [Lacticaseibacillus salsurivasis]|uniref:C39 family peptidase n=1 Tax=Lacticaseibacillus salsurivasis TaxID=3081441 RepID=UPI0030C68E4C